MKIKYPIFFLFISLISGQLIQESGQNAFDFSQEVWIIFVLYLFRIIVSY